MNENIIAKWTSSSTTDKTLTVIPDGCRDLIIRQNSENEFHWHISPLFDQSENVHIKANTVISGFRFRPGLEINEEDLIKKIKNKTLIRDKNTIYSLINDHTYFNTNLAEALECLRSDMIDIKKTANELGVSLRTLQRVIKKGTGKTPKYWKNLARVRISARDILAGDNYSEIAYKNGYSDQAHMCREIKHWLKVNPTQIKKMNYISEQLDNEAYS